MYRMNQTKPKYCVGFFKALRETLYVSAIQMQQSYAYKYDVNFLAAGANHPSYGNAGLLAFF